MTLSKSADRLRKRRERQKKRLLNNNPIVHTEEYINILEYGNEALINSPQCNIIPFADSERRKEALSYLIEAGIQSIRNGETKVNPKQMIEAIDILNKMQYTYDNTSALLANIQNNQQVNIIMTGNNDDKQRMQRLLAGGAPVEGEGVDAGPGSADAGPVGAQTHVHHSDHHIVKEVEIDDKEVTEAFSPGGDVPVMDISDNGSILDPVGDIDSVDTEYDNREHKDDDRKGGGCPF